MENKRGGNQFMKRKMRNLLWILCIWTIAILFVPSISAKAKEIRSGKIYGCSYILDDTGTFTISPIKDEIGAGLMYDYSRASNRPWEMYKDLDMITKVVIEDGVKNIGDYAFQGCTNLTEVSLGKDLSRIGKNAFYGCTQLTEIELNEGLMKLDGFSFAFTGITSIKLPSSVTMIEDFSSNSMKDIFYDGTKEDWAKVTKKGNVHNVEKILHYKSQTYNVTLNTNGGTINTGNIVTYESNTGAVLPIDVTKKDYIFVGWYDNPELSGERVEKITTYDTGDKTYYAKWKVESYTVTYIQGTAGSSTSTAKVRNGEELTLPENMFSVPEYWAFNKWQIGDNTLNLKNPGDKIVVDEDITIRAIWRIVGGGGLSDGCKWEVKNGTLTIRKNTTGIMEDYQQNLDYNNNLISTAPWYSFNDVITAIKIENGVTQTGEYAFFSLNNVKQISIPESVTTLGDYSFAKCYKLESVTIPGQVKIISECAFLHCDNMKKIVISEGVEKIAAEAFECVGEKVNDVEIVIPRSMKTIDDGAFYGANIQKVYYNGSQAEWNQIAIDEENEELSAASIQYLDLGKTNTPDPTPTPTPEPTPTPTPEPTPTPTPEPTPEPTPTPDSTPAPSPSQEDDKKSSENADSAENSPTTSDQVHSSDSDKKKTTEVVDKKQKNAKLSKPKAGKKSFTIKWKKQTAKGIAGYELQYSTDKNFKKDVKKVTINKTKTTSKTIKKLKSKKTYYVRIRTFKKVNKAKVYSKWSGKKSVKVK